MLHCPGVPDRPVLVEEMGVALVPGAVNAFAMAIHSGQARSGKAVQRDDIRAFVAYAQRLLDADFFGLRASGGEQGQCVVENDSVNSMHGFSTLGRGRNGPWNECPNGRKGVGRGLPAGGVAYF